MFQYLVSGYDASTEEALAHRMAVRPTHLEFIKICKERGEFIAGGAHLNEAGTMCGSTVILQFDSPEGIQIYEANEPYITQKVWERYTITPFRIANV